MPIHPDDYEAAQALPAEIFVGADSPDDYRAALDLGFADSLGSSGSLDRDSSGVDLSVMGLGASKPNPNVAPQGQHANVELAAKLAQTKQVDQQIQNLIASLSGSLSTNQTALLASPQTQGLVTTVQSALADLQNAQSQLESSFWDGQNFNTFTGSSNAWNLMDQAAAAAQQKLQSYAQLASQLASGVAVGRQAADLVQQAASTVSQAILQAQSLAQSGHADQATTVLQSPSVQQAAQASGQVAALQSTVQQIQSLATQQASQSLDGQIAAAQGLAQSDPATALTNLQSLSAVASALNRSRDLQAAISQVTQAQRSAGQVAALQSNVAQNLQNAIASLANAQASVSSAQSQGANVGGANGLLSNAQATLSQVQSQLAFATDLSSLNNLNAQIASAQAQAQNAASMAAQAVALAQSQSQAQGQAQAQALAEAQARLPLQQSAQDFDQQLRLAQAQDQSFEHAIQALASLAPLLGKDEAGALAGAALAQELGIDPSTISQVAGGAHAPAGTSDLGEPYVTGFGPETF